MRRRTAWRTTAVAVSAGLVSAAALVWAAEPDFHISAHVDKTTIEVGSPVNLVITLEGDLQRATVEPFTFPPAFSIGVQSRSTNVSIQAGRMKRSVSLTYVLLPREAGTFTLGPFQVLYDGKPVLTEPIDITVSRPVLPPGSDDHQRYAL